MKWQPERGKTVEVGYVRNLQKLLNAERHADVKINYYNTVMENVFDRNGRLEFTRVDKHKTAGIEARPATTTAASLWTSVLITA